jgi:hypothetical protein
VKFDYLISVAFLKSQIVRLGWNAQVLLPPTLTNDTIANPDAELDYKAKLVYNYHYSLGVFEQ